MGRVSVMLGQIGKSYERFGEVYNSFHAEDLGIALQQVKQMQGHNTRISHRLAEIMLDLRRAQKELEGE